MGERAEQVDVAFPEPPQPPSVQSSVSVHDQDSPAQRARMSPTNFHLYYCFTDYIEAIAVNPDALRVEHDALDNFPEEPPDPAYMTLICLDCILASTVREVAERRGLRRLDADRLNELDVQERREILAETLDWNSIVSLYVLVGREHQDFDAIWGMTPENGWLRLFIDIPTEGEPRSLDAQINQALAADGCCFWVARNATTDAAFPTTVGPAGDIQEVEAAWLAETISFNHIADVGTPGPEPDGPPPTPPVPIFPLLDPGGDPIWPSKLQWLVNNAFWSTLREGDDFTERFHRIGNHFWRHEGTGLVTIENGRCWVDRDGRAYRLYADDAARPKRLFFEWIPDGDEEVPPQLQFPNAKPYPHASFTYADVRVTPFPGESDWRSAVAVAAG